MPIIRRSLLTGLALALAAPALQAQADYPQRAVRLVVPYAAGGGTDVLVRVVAKAMATHLGQPIVVDNKPGGGTSIGAAEVARAAPDGYTWLWGDNTTFALNPFLYKKLPYAPLQDFAPISLTLDGALCLVVSPTLGVASLRELLAYAKANPGKLSYASAGNGTPHHLAMEALKLQAGVDLQHVPYKGEAPGMNDILGGVIHLMFVGTTTSHQHVEAGRLKYLATAGATRNKAVPDVPTVAEGGLPGFDASFWHALVAPAKTPAAVLAKVHAAYAKASRDPEVQAYLARNGGNTLRVSSPQELRTHMQEQTQAAQVLIRAIDLKLD